MSKIKKDRVNEDIFIPDLVNQYKNAITTLFKTVSFEMDSFGAKNNFYYSDSISNLSYRYRRLEHPCYLLILLIFIQISPSFSLTHRRLSPYLTFYCI
jgi:hypothetical protein